MSLQTEIISTNTACKLFFMLSVLLLLASCATPSTKDPYARTDAELAQDLAEIPQSLTYFVKQNPQTANTPLTKPYLLAEATERARKLFFTPWRLKKASREVGLAMHSAFYLKPEKGFIENLRPYPPERWEALIRNCNIAAYPAHALPAITLERVDLRLLPTSSPYFFSPSIAGQGYPFDYLQNSSLPLATPVFITHSSLDMAWVYIESVSASGWVEAKKIAQVDTGFMQKWQELPLAAITAENAVLTQIIQPQSLNHTVTDTSSRAAKPSAQTSSATQANKAPKTPNPAANPHAVKTKLVRAVLPPVQHASIGTLLPYSGSLPAAGASYPNAFTPDILVHDTHTTDKSRVEQVPGSDSAVETPTPEPLPETILVHLPLRNQQGMAYIAQFRVDAAQLSAWPLPFTPAKVAELGDEMMGQPYGWGGYATNRDCSAMLRELLLSFGLWLPRNSASQMKIGTAIDLGVFKAEEKEKIVQEHGLPFASLIGMPGHIALYVGTYKGKAVMFHNMWGLRVKVAGQNKDGRAVIGKAVITSLTPGRERQDISRKNSLLDVIHTLSFPAPAVSAPIGSPKESDNVDTPVP